MPFENSSIIKDTKLSKKTIEKLLNEIFSLNRDKNKKEVKKFAKEKDILTTSFIEIVDLGQLFF